MNNENPDELQRCAVAYQKMINDKIQYQVKIFSEGNITNFEIKNTPFDFQHLTAVHEKKISDIWEVNNLPRLSSKNFLNEILDNHFSYYNVEKSNFYFDDIKKPENMTDEEFESAKETAKTDHKMFKSKLSDRLSALENLYSIMKHAGFEETDSDFVLKIYKWDKTTRKENRPHDSTIEADYLLEFYDRNNPDKPFVDFFVIENKKGCYNGVSIFRSPFTYSCDTEQEKTIRKETALKNHRTPPPDRNVSEIEILSVTETQEKSSDKTVIMTKSDEYIKQCEKESKETQRKSAYKEILKTENKKIESIINNLKKNRMCKSPKQQREYDKIFSKLNTDGTEGLLKTLLKRLSSSKADAKDNNLSEKIDSEIEKINNIAESKGWNLSEFHILDSHHSGQINITPNGAAAIPVYHNSFKDALRSLADSFKTFLQDIADKIQEIPARAFSKPQNADTAPPAEKENAPTADTEKSNSPQDKILEIYHTAVRHHENYFEIIPEKEILSEISMSFTTEYIQKQQVTHEPQAENTAPQPMKQQIEYDDF